MIAASKRYKEGPGRPTIVYVHPHMTMQTGGTNFVLDTAVGLQERGWPVVIVAQKADAAIVGARDVAIVELGGPLPSDPRHWLGLAGLERRVFAALDHIPHKILFPQVHPANYWAFAYKAARPWVPCVWMCQEPSAFVHSWSNIRSLRGVMRYATMAANPPLQVIDRVLVAQTDHIIANSQFTAAAIRRVYGREADAVVEPGIGADAFDVPHVPRDAIVCLGSLIRFKRVDLAVRGYAQAHRALGDAVPPLVLAGDGPEAPALRALVTALGLERHVRFVGKVSDKEKRRLFARAVACVSTAPQEPFGLVCVEAMAAGAPVLAPDQGGPRETVCDGATGRLYRAGDADDLGRMLLEMLTRPGELARMSLAARRHVQERYTLEHTVDGLDRVFCDMVRREDTLQ